ncbi:hypothetical protein WJX84_009594 [Apatococcus fuscideae]|uniref:TRAF3-interacting protein 1 N-terminal domain-containing protein n=1 Tax=Apatococcus fuscideae TaxID=2026836 RepID=A0AAW1TED3_9CHLO
MSGSGVVQTGFAQDSIPAGSDAAIAGQSREGKIAYLEKVFAEVSLATGRTVPARPSKVVAGLEPENTNIFLQMLAEAATAKKPPQPGQSSDGHVVNLPPVRPRSHHPAHPPRDLASAAAAPAQPDGPDLSIVGAGIAATHSLLQEAAPVALPLPQDSNDAGGAVLLPANPSSSQSKATVGRAAGSSRGGDGMGRSSIGGATGDGRAPRRSISQKPPEEGLAQALLGPTSPVRMHFPSLSQSPVQPSPISPVQGPVYGRSPSGKAGAAAAAGSESAKAPPSVHRSQPQAGSGITRSSSSPVQASGATRSSHTGRRASRQAPATSDNFAMAAALVMQTAQVAQQLARCWERCASLETSA